MTIRKVSFSSALALALISGFGFAQENKAAAEKAPAPGSRKHPTYQDLTKPEEGTPWDQIKLKDSKNAAVTLADYRGKLLLVNFFFASCPSVCPPQTQGLVNTIKGLDAETRKNVEFVSITIDPEHDTPQKLEEYKKTFKITEDEWAFVIAPRADMEKIANHFGSLGEKSNPLEHKARIYLVDPKGQYLLSYASSPVDSKRLVKDLTEAVKTFVKKPAH